MHFGILLIRGDAGTLRAGTNGGNVVVVGILNQSVVLNYRGKNNEENYCFFRTHLGKDIIHLWASVAWGGGVGSSQSGDITYNSNQRLDGTSFAAPHGCRGVPCGYARLDFRSGDRDRRSQSVLLGLRYAGCPQLPGQHDFSPLTLPAVLALIRTVAASGCCRSMPTRLLLLVGTEV